MSKLHAMFFDTNYFKHLLVISRIFFLLLVKKINEFEWKKKFKNSKNLKVAGNNPNI